MQWMRFWRHASINAAETWLSWLSRMSPRQLPFALRSVVSACRYALQAHFSRVSGSNSFSTQLTPNSLSVHPFGDAAIHAFSSSESLAHAYDGRFPFIMMNGGRTLPSAQTPSITVTISRLPSKETEPRPEFESVSTHLVERAVHSVSSPSSYPFLFA